MAVPLDSVTSITLELIRKRLADNIFLANGTLAYLLSKGRVEIHNGGNYIQAPLMYATNSSVKYYSGYETLDMTAQEEITAATYNWRQGAVCIAMNGLEDMKNSGEQAVLDLWRSKMRVAELSLQQSLDQKIHASSATKNLAKDFLGLDEFVEDAAAPTGSTVGGIVRNAANAWWASKYKAGTMATLTNDMRSLYFTCSEGNEQPDIGIMPQELMEQYEIQNAGKQRMQNIQMLNVGFENFMFKSATMLLNRNCIGAGGSGPYNLYFLNSKYIKFVIHRDRYFSMRAPQMPINQDARVAYILIGGNLTLDNSRFQGVLVVT